MSFPTSPSFFLDVASTVSVLTAILVVVRRLVPAAREAFGQAPETGDMAAAGRAVSAEIGPMAPAGPPRRATAYWQGPDVPFASWRPFSQGDAGLPEGPSTASLVGRVAAALSDVAFLLLLTLITRFASAPWTEWGEKLMSGITPFPKFVLSLLSLISVVLVVVRPHAPRMCARSTRPAFASWVFDLTFVAAAACAGMLALEVSWNDSLSTMHAEAICAEFAMVATAMVALYALCGRHTWLARLVPAVLVLGGIAEGFVRSFRGNPATVADLFALGTALSVASQYEYVLWDSAVSGVGIAVLATALARLPMGPLPVREQRKELGRHGEARPSPVAPGLAALAARRGTVGAAGRPGVAADATGRGRLRTAASYMVPLVAAALAWAAIWGADWYQAIGMRIDWWPWSQVYSFFQWGTLPTFVQTKNVIKVFVPDKYDEGEAAEELGRLAGEWREADGASDGTSPVRPNILAVMNETYADMTVIDGIGLPEDARPWFLREAPEGTIDSGALRVSVLGGGTCNSEVEFLTGTSMLSISGPATNTIGGGASKAPYSFYDLSEVPSLAKQLREQGYRTVAMHPNLATNWNRERRYQQLGFDEFLSIDSFEDEDGYEWFHSGASDRETYAKSLDVIRSSDEPVFVFDVTMQNHGSYYQDNIPEELRVHYDLPDAIWTHTTEMDEYMSCLAESDRALRELVDEAEALGEPTIIVFFGDHQPSFSSEMYEELHARDAGDGDDGLAESDEIYQTCYLIWSNYDLATGELRAQPPVDDGDQDGEREDWDDDGDWWDTGGDAGDGALWQVADAAPTDAATDGQGQGAAQGEGEGADDPDAPQPAPSVTAQATQPQEQPTLAGGAAETPAPPHEVGLNALAALALHEGGLPLTDHQAATLMLRKGTPSVSLYGFMGNDGEWALPTDERHADQLRRMLEIDYLACGSRLRLG